MAGEKGPPGRVISVLQLGFVFIANVLVFTWIGARIDAALSKRGLFTALFIIFGVVTSFVISGIALAGIARRHKE
ncbi:MAG: AtpZ/AtpI family protein [Firmicutes bacterium]|nr:AtpZ/AtpI family protein [Bacillota bacterium]